MISSHDIKLSLVRLIKNLNNELEKDDCSLMRVIVLYDDCDKIKCFDFEIN